MTFGRITPLPIAHRTFDEPPARSYETKGSKPFLMWVLGTILGLTLAIDVSTVSASGGITESGLPKSDGADQFAEHNPQLARLIQDADAAYENTQELQDFFIACGGLGEPTPSCGLASAFYDQLAERFNLPKQEVMDVKRYLDLQYQTRKSIKEALDKLRSSVDVCLGKICVTVRYPGSLSHYLDKVLDFPEASKLKHRIRDAYHELEKELHMKQQLEKTIAQIDDKINLLKEVQAAIDSENKKVADKAKSLAATALKDVIDPVLDPLLEGVAQEVAKFVTKLDSDYLRGQLEEGLSWARNGVPSSQLRAISADLKNEVSEKTQAGADPLEVMPIDLTAVIFGLMATCVDRPDAETAKSCSQELLAPGILSLAEDLARSFYTHTSRRFLYQPCSAQLADDVTTEAAADTFGISCAAYKTLQQSIEQMMERAGDGFYETTVAPLVKSFVRDHLKSSAAEQAHSVVEPIPLVAFRFPGQNNQPVKLTHCDQSSGRFLLSDHICLAPLEKLYIYTWSEAANTCALKFGAPLCTKDEVAAGQKNGYSYCAYSWTGTSAGPGKAYQVTPMASNARGCPPAGLNATAQPISRQLSALCCVPFTE